MSRGLLVGMAVFGALAGAGGMMLADRIAPGDLAAADRTRVERVVRDYVLANPEIIPEAMQRLQQQDAARAVTANRGAIEEPYHGAWMGNPRGDVTLVEFYDYNCGFCRAALPVIQRLVKEDPNLRVVFRELPVLAESSRDAARAALAAARQDRFRPFHEALYAGGPVNDASIAAAARRAGVNLATIPDDADATIRANMELATKLGISGTPAWVVGDQVMTGMMPIERLRAAIVRARAR